MTATQQRLGVAAILVALLIWLPRGLMLDRFVTADEHAWLARAGNFYYALAHGEWAGTFQRHHPGVTVTWAGLLGYLTTYPGYAAEAPGQFGWLTEEVEPFLRDQGHDPVAVLAAGRSMAVLLITLALAGAFLLAQRLWGWWAAGLGIGLIAFAPFHIAHSRLLHLDGMVSTFMFLALLAWLAYLQKPRRGLLALAGVAAGLAWLTRSPALFLAPFIGLLTLATVWTQDQADSTRRIWRAALGSLAVWGVLGLGVVVALWPAMWVDPLGSLRQVLNAAGEYAAEGHLKPTFFAGEIHAGDPGFWFYPVTWLWRSTPIVWVGMLCALVELLRVGLARGRKPQGVAPLDTPFRRWAVWTLLVYAVTFMLFMNIGAKKFDRYILVSYLPLQLMAGAGWTVALQWAAHWAMRRRWGAKLAASGRLDALLALAATLVVGGQSLFALPTFPYYLSYYNPVLGGSARAPRVMQIGWGEGADLAGRYLDAKPEAADLTVASGYTNGPLSYFFRGRTLPLYFGHDAEYAAVFIQDRQRLLPSRRAAAYFQSLNPEATITLDGLDYAHLYDLRQAPLPAYVTDWRWNGEAAIRLATFQLPAAPIAPGETVQSIFYLVNRAPIDTNLNVLVRLVGMDGEEIAREEGWPWGAATSSWERGVTWPDGHNLAIPPGTEPGYYRVELGFYDPATGETLSAVQARTGDARRDMVTVDILRVGELPVDYPQPFSPPVRYGEAIDLLGAEWRGPDGGALAGARSADGAFEPGIALQPGDALTVTLTWDARAWMGTDYTAFVHLVGPDGALVAQHDKQPLDGALPTHTWAPNQPVRDAFTLALPEDASAGEYTLYTGFYDLATTTRLPVFRKDEPLGDALRLGTLQVEAP